MQMSEWLATALDPALLMHAVGMAPDPWQADLLRSEADRVLLLTTRQAGKSTTTALRALHRILFYPQSLVLMCSPSQRQSGELFRKLVDFYITLEKPVPPVQETALSLTLANGSRCVALPGVGATVRGYSAVNLLIVDEAAQSSDDLLGSVAPMLATSGGRLVALSTPFGQRGWFHEAWNDTAGSWERFRITADLCPRIPAEFLASERRTLGERWYKQEYMCSFESTLDQMFSTESVLGAFRSTEAALLEG